MASVCQRRGRSGRGPAAPRAANTLYDVPVSNNGARCRIVIYGKGLEDQIAIQTPSDAFGGLKEPGYLAVNPQGKMPALDFGGLCLAESETINEFLVDKFADVGPSFVAATPELRAKSRLASRVHDMYLTTIQGCMYKGAPVYEGDGGAALRAEHIKQLNYQLDVLEGIFGEEGPYFAGSEQSLGDCAVFPTMVFAEYSLLKFFGWPTLFAGRPKLEAWFTAMVEDPVSGRVYKEVRGGLEKWDGIGRWDNLGITEQIAAHPELKWSYP